MTSPQWNWVNNCWLNLLLHWKTIFLYNSNLWCHLKWYNSIFRIYRIDQHNRYIFEQFLAFLVLVPRLLIVKLLILLLLMQVHKQQYIIEVLCKMLYFDHKLLIMLNNPFLKSFDVFLVFLLYYQYFFLLHHILFLFVLLY